MIHVKTSVVVRLSLGLAAAACMASKSPHRPSQGGTMEVTSSVLLAGQPIAAPYACTDHDNLGKSPPISWASGPEGTVAYAVTMRDPDANGFVHWALVNLPPTTTRLPEGASPGGALPPGAIELTNDFGKRGYGGPCPPPGAPHHYVIEVTALGSKITATKADAALFQQIANKALATGRMTVTYRRSM